MVVKHRPTCRELLFHELSDVNKLIALGRGDEGLLASVWPTRKLRAAEHFSLHEWSFQKRLREQERNQLILRHPP